MSHDASAADHANPRLAALRAGDYTPDGGGLIDVQVFNAQYQFGKIYLYVLLAAVSPNTFNSLLLGWGDNVSYGYSDLEYQGTPTAANLMLLVPWTPPQGITSVPAVLFAVMNTPSGRQNVTVNTTIYL